MKFRFLLAIIICLNLQSFLVYGNKRKATIDSLKHVIESDETHDTLKVLVYYNLAKLYYNTNFDLFKATADSGLYLSEKIDYKFGIANSLFLQGAYYRMTRHLDSAQIKMNQSLGIFLQLNDSYNAARCYNDLGTLCRYKGKRDSAIFFFNKAREMFIESGKPAGEAATYVNMAIIHRQDNDYSLAIEKYKKAIELYSSVKDNANCALAYRNLGGLYKILEDYSQSIEHYIESVRFSKKSNNKRTESVAYISISQMFFIQDQFHESLTYAQKSWQIVSELNSPLDKISTLNTLASIYIELDSLDNALKLCNKALHLYNEGIDISYKTSVYDVIAKAYHLKGDIEKAEKYFTESLILIKLSKRNLNYSGKLNKIGNFYFEIGKLKDAEKYFTEGLQRANKAESYYDIRDASKGLADLNEKFGNYKKSLFYFKQYQQYADSIINEENTKKILKETLNYEHQSEIHKIELEQEKRNLLAEQEKDKQVALRNTFLIGFLFLSIVSALIFIGFRKNRKKNKELAELNHEINSQKELILAQNDELTISNKKLVELDQFKEAMTGMIVHDLKNPLNTIIHAAPDTTNFAKKIRNSGKQMLNMVLNILDLQKYENSTMLIDLRHEDLNVLIKESIEDVRFLCEEKNIQLKVEIGYNYKVRSEKEILNRILVNLLTNAIKYSSNNDVITIKAVETEHQSKVRVEICDKGPGIDKSGQAKIFQRFAQQQAKDSGKIQSTGLGLAFCKLAVEAHGGTIGVKSEPGKGACFWFTLNLLQSGTDLKRQSTEMIVSENLPILTSTEIKHISKNIEQLQNTKIYQISQLNKILTDLDYDSSENIKLWKEHVEMAIRTEDVATFNKLTDIQMNN